jgi:catechol 2,3-dioxygenase-like lactoylglutathione lyase family enzyme
MTTPLVSSLRSVEIGLPDVAAAEAFFTGTWGLSVAARQGDAVYLRGTGADHHLLALHPADQPELRMVTLRAPSTRELDQLLQTVPANGGSVLSQRAPVTEPGGGEAVIVRDPQGRILRIVTGDARHADTEGLRFYENAFGMRLSDRTRIMAFIRIPAQPRGDHHSIALADADNDCLNHIAFVMPDLESVMRGGGRMKDAGYGIEWGPGRHGPGNNSFNYFVGPAGFVIEYTADVEQIDDSYPVRGPDDWKWPAGRVDHWGISAPPSARLKEAQRQIHFASGLKA